MRELLENAPEYLPAENTGLIAISFSDLIQKEFEPVRWIVPELLPEGLTILAGGSKLGKSWLALSLCLSVSSGGLSINQMPVQQGGSLYLALEDNQRRLKDRLIRLQNGVEGQPLGLNFATEIPRSNLGGFQMIEEWLENHPDCRLVVVDTFQRFRECSYGGRETYGSDYESMMPLHRLANDKRISVVLVHHTRKMAATDEFDRISGTTGLVGCSDCSWVLSRTRGEYDGKLSITGRDVTEQELAVQFDPDTCTWAVVGDAREVAATKEEAEVFDLVRAMKNITPRIVAEELDISKSAAKMRLKRMADAGKLDRSPDGKGYIRAYGHMVTHGHTTNVTSKNQARVGIEGKGHNGHTIINQEENQSPINTVTPVTNGAESYPSECIDRSHPKVTDCDPCDRSAMPIIEGVI